MLDGGKDMISYIPSFDSFDIQVTMSSAIRLWKHNQRSELTYHNKYI